MMHGRVASCIVKLLLTLRLVTLVSSQTTFPPYSFTPFTVLLPSSTLPNVNSTAVINIAASFSLTGAYSSGGASCAAAATLWIQRANAHGGVTVNGTNFYYALTSIDDGSSAGYVYDIYSRWAASTSPVYDVLLAPDENSLTYAALTAVRPYYKTFISTIADASYIFDGSYPFIYSVQSLDLIQQSSIIAFANRLPDPPRNIALLQRVDPAPVVIVPPNITGSGGLLYGYNIIGWDLYNFPADSVATIPNFVQFLTPDFPNPIYTDAVVLMSTTVEDFYAAVAAMAQLQVNPKAAFYSSLFPDDANPAFNLRATGWVTYFIWEESLLYQSTLPSVVYANTSKFLQDYASAYSQTADIFAVSVAASLDVMTSALSQSASLSSTDVLTSMNNMSGTTIMGAFQLYPYVHFNERAVYFPFQLQNGVNVFIDSIEKLDYPVVWPWQSVRAGDHLHTDQTSTLIPIAVFLSIAGYWVGLLLVEQAILYKRSKKFLVRYYLWLYLMSISMGAAGVWTALLVQTAAWTVDCAQCTADMTVSYSLGISLLALVPAVILTFIGLVIIGSSIKTTDTRVTPLQSDIGASDIDIPILSVSVRSSKRNTSAAPATRSDVYGRVRSAFLHLYSDGSLRMVIGSGFIAAAIVATRQTLMAGVILNGTLQDNVIAAVFSSLIVWMITSVAMTVYFYAVYYRFFGFVLLTAASLFHYQFLFALMTVSYAPTEVDDLSDNNIYAHSVDPLIVTLIASVFGAVTGVIFIGLQFNAMQLSYQALALVIQKQNGKLTSAATQRRHLKAQIRNGEVLISEMSKQLDVITLSRPKLFTDETNILSPEMIVAFNGAFSSETTAFHTSAILCRDELKLASNGSAHGLLKAEYAMAYDEQRMCKALANVKSCSAPLPSYEPSMMAIFSHPLTVEILKDELQLAMSVENIVFIALVQRYRRIGSRNVRAAFAQQIFSEYLEDKSAQQINISAALRQSMKKRVSVQNCSDVDMFDQCVKEIVSLISSNNWKKFISSTAYRRCALILQRNVAVMEPLINSATVEAINTAANADYDLLLQSTHRVLSPQRRMHSELANNLLSHRGHRGDDDAMTPLHTSQVAHEDEEVLAEVELASHRHRSIR